MGYFSSYGHVENAEINIYLIVWEGGGGVDPKLHTIGHHNTSTVGRALKLKLGSPVTFCRSMKGTSIDD